MAKCCNDNLSKIFCNAYNKYYNTLYTNGEISKKETENLLVISYIRKLFINPRYINYRPILIKALRCIADRSCLLDSSELYGRLDIKTVGDKFVTVQMRDIYSVKIEETDPTVPQYVKNITEQDIDRWNNPSTNNILIVKFTENNNTVTCDTSIADIYAAVSAGTEVVGLTSDSTSQTWASLRVSVAASKFCVFDMQYGGVYVYLMGGIENGTDVWQRDQSLRLVTDDQVVRWNNKQDALVSGTNIKTINNQSLLGSGNINLVPTETFNNFCPIIEDTRSSAVATITGVAPFASLETGQKILLHLAYNTVFSTTLKLTLSDGITTTGTKKMKIAYNTSFVDVGSEYTYIAGCYIPLIYDGTNRYWRVIGRENDTTYSSMTQANINSGTATTNTVSAKLIHDNAYIVEETYSSGSLKANKFYDFGTVSSALTIPSLDATNDLVSNALNFYALRFIAGADNISITFPTGVVVDDTPTINTGDYVEIMINLYVENNTNHFYASIKVWQAQ